MIPSVMQAAVMYGPRDIRLEQRPVPKPGQQEALVRIRTVGICGSDLHYYERGRIGAYLVERPLVLGHECSGEVVAVGARTTRVTVGQRVAIEPGVTCGRCRYCKAGRYNICPDVRFLATPPVDGAFCQYLVMPEDLLFPLPDTMTDEEGALVEPLSAGIQACLRTGLRPGESVVITGAGPIGLLALAAARSFGAKLILSFDRLQNRLEVARRMGADLALDVAMPDVMTRARRVLGEGADVVIEASGSSEALRLGLDLVRRGGRVAIIGLSGEPEVPVDVTRLVNGELDIHGIFRYANTYPIALALFQRHQIDITPMITGRYPLSRAKEVMDQLLTDRGRHVKVMIEPQAE